MSKHPLILPESQFGSGPVSGWPDYSECGFPESQTFEEVVFGEALHEESIPTKLPLSLMGCSLGTDSIPAYGEHGLLDSEGIYDHLPVAWGRSSSKRCTEKPSQAPPPPDISEGIGRNQSKKDLVLLYDHLRSNTSFTVAEEEVYRYNGQFWEKLSQRSAIRAIKEFFLDFEDVRCVLSDRDYRELYYQLLTDPLLVHEGRLVGPTDKLNCLDGTLDLSVWPPRKAEHNPENGFLSVLPLFCDEILYPPMDGLNFEAFVMSVSGGDPAIRQQLLEMTILALTGLQLKHLYVILGPTNSGKSQWGRFLLELLGTKNVAAVCDIDDFGEQWTTGSLAGKRLATCMDLPDRPVSKKAIGMLKQFCGDDAIKANVKYKDSFTYYEKPLVLLAGNHPIRIPNADKEEAFLNRMVIVPFSMSISEGEKVLEFYQKLLDEAPYIVHEAIFAYSDLVNRNFELTRAEVPIEYRPKEGRSLYAAVRDFVTEVLTEVQGAEITTAELYALFCEQGSCLDVSDTVFSRTLSQLLTQLMPMVSAVKRVKGTDKRGYKNLAVIPAL